VVGVGPVPGVVVVVVNIDVAFGVVSFVGVSSVGVSFVASKVVGSSVAIEKHL